MRSKEFVYMARRRGKGRTLKIGYTWNVRLRIGALKRKHKSLRLVGYIPFQEKDQAIRTEKTLHELARLSHGILVPEYRGDWHFPAPDLIDIFFKYPGAVRG